MLRQFTLEYWIDDSWYVGRLKEVPNIFSQGENLDELQDNIQDAYQLMLTEQTKSPVQDLQHLEIEVEV